MKLTVDLSGACEERYVFERQPPATTDAEAILGACEELVADDYRFTGPVTFTVTRDVEPYGPHAA